MLWSGSNRKRLWLLLTGIVATTSAALFLLLPIRGSNLANGTAGWTAQGCFVQGGVYPTTRFDSQITAHERQGVTLWGSHCGNDASTGVLQSPLFKAPSILELFISGYVGGADKPGLQLLLETADAHMRVPIQLTHQPGETWLTLHWWTPSELRGQQVRLVAIDRDKGWGGWLGVSNPRRLLSPEFLPRGIEIFFANDGNLSPPIDPFSPARVRRGEHSNRSHQPPSDIAHLPRHGRDLRKCHPRLSRFLGLLLLQRLGSVFQFRYLSDCGRVTSSAECESARCHQKGCQRPLRAVSLCRTRRPVLHEFLLLL